MKKILILAMLMTGVLCSAVFGADVSVNGDILDTEAIIMEDSTYVPVRGVFEHIGYDVVWNDVTNTASIMGDGNIVDINEDIKVNGIKIDGEVKNVDGRLYIPIRAVSEAIGCEVTWDSESKCANIVYEDKMVTEKSFVYRINEKMPEDKNYVFSPISVKLALAMAANGAEGNTLKEITDTVDIGDGGIGEYNKYVKKLMSDYDKNEIMDVGNGVWLNTSQTGNAVLNEKFKSTLEDYYSAETGEVDNNNAVRVINDFVYEKTAGRIKELISDSEFVACIVNTVCFTGEWQNKFQYMTTHEDEFTNADGSVKKIKFMNNDYDTEYYGDHKIEIIKMPFKGGDMSAYIAVTEDKNMDIEPYIEKMEKRYVSIHMPKFEVESTIDFNDILKSLGVKDMFDIQNAKLDGIVKGLNVNLYVSKVLQKCMITVDEEGAKAAAATGLTMTGTGFIEDKVYFNADKPFTYLIRDDRSGEILFMGRYAYAQ